MVNIKNLTARRVDNSLKDLKGCPECGSPAGQGWSHMGSFIHCTDHDCGYHIGGKDYPVDQLQLGKVWNNRD